MPELVLRKEGRTPGEVANQVRDLLVQLGKIPAGGRARVLSVYTVPFISATIGRNPPRTIIDRRDRYEISLDPGYAWVEETEREYKVYYSVNPRNAR